MEGWKVKMSSLDKEEGNRRRRECRMIVGYRRAKYQPKRVICF